MTTQNRKLNKKGVALLIVLFIIMVIMICSVGFLSRSNVELATGQNMALRIQMDYLAESGLDLITATDLKDAAAKVAEIARA